jgi:hypothetical protein
MRRYGMWIAVVIVVFVNSYVLFGVAYNRSGEPEATITLTERELPVESFWEYSRGKENSGISLRLFWRRFPIWEYSNENSLSDTTWFDKTKLESIGFRCSMPVTDPEAEIYYNKQLSRKSFAVLEYDGGAWQEWLRRATEREKPKKVACYQETSSRLFVIDVGNDPERLRQLHPDRSKFIIVPAKVGLHYQRRATEPGQKREQPILQGYIAEILVDEINVPYHLKRLLEEIRKTAVRERVEACGDAMFQRRYKPSYTVSLHVGRRYEPWIADIKPITR